jgi:hypothetical protein
MTFGAGSSHAQVCRYCRTVVVRTDREWKNLGKAADLANTPSKLAVGDRGALRGRSFEVLGRAQLDYGQGPWDEFYVRYADGAWGWVAEAQGNLYVTQKAEDGGALPPPQALAVDQALSLGRYGAFKVVERRDARLLTAEGELPFPPSARRLYADCHGPGGAFATLDYNDGSRPPELYVGAIIALSEVTLERRAGERPGAAAAALTEMTCGQCGGKLPPPKPGVERVACRHCNTISECSTMRVLAQQAAARQRPTLPLGASGTLGGTPYVVIGYCERSASVEGERFFWQEYLLWSESVGFRWVMCDEGNWLFVTPISAADVQSDAQRARWHGRTFQLRNRNDAQVEYVLGEFYWKVEVGETVQASDYIAGSDVLSREQTRDEVNWSYCTPVSFAQLAQAFGVAPDSLNQAQTFTPAQHASPGGGNEGVWILIAICIVLCIACVAMTNSEGGSSFGGGGGGYSGGGSSFGGFGGK